MAAELLKNYLAWQAEVGCDEVILDRPLPKKKSEIKMVETEFAKPFSHAPAFSATTPAHIFGDLARSFDAEAKSEIPKGNGKGNGKLFTFPSSPSKTEPEIKKVSPDVASWIPAPTFHEFWAQLNSTAKNIYGEDFTGKILFGKVPNEKAQERKDISALTTPTPSASPPLSLISFEPSQINEIEEKIFSGEAEVLVEKMFKAIKLDVRDIYQTALVKYYSAGKVWSRRDWVRIFPILQNELTLSRAPIHLILGENCAQAILKTSKPIDELRQIPHRISDLEFIVSYHPNDLLRKDELKRKAWDDLQWLQRRMNQKQEQEIV